MAQLQRLAIAPAQLQNQQITLTAEQQHYLGRVLRLRTGDRFLAIDGSGNWWLAELTNQETEARAKILESVAVQTELSIPTTLVAALPKGSGFDEVVRQATEMGVVCIAPVISDRTLLKPSPQKLERWRRIAQEAAEQSERQIVPIILDPTSFLTHLQKHQSPNLQQSTQRYICVARGSLPHLSDCLHRQSDDILLATGPEGGWTDAEVERAIAAGYQPVSLGRRILRSVTAPLAALTLIAAALETIPVSDQTV